MFDAIKTAFSRSCLHYHHENQHQVFVNVYDMLQPSFLTSFGYYALGVGIYHSGVEICGKEYCFGGHEYKNITGVFAVEAKVGPPGLLFKQSISVGYTNLTNDQIHKLIQDISKDYVGTSYNLLTRNCNHFTDDLCVRLTGKHAPSWINRAAKLGTMFPCVIPTEWIEPPDLEGEVMPSNSSNDQSSGSNMSYSSKAPLKSTTTTSTLSTSPKPSSHKTQPRSKETTSISSSPTTESATMPTTGTAATSTTSTAVQYKLSSSPPPSSSNPTSRPTSRTSSTTSIEIRHPQQHQPHHLYSLSTALTNNSSHHHRQSSSPTSPNSPKHRRPSGSLAGDGESIFFGRTSPITCDDDQDMTDRIKEPGSHHPEVIRSATQLSISASLQELDR
ncbi:PPPDE putative peptidase domain-domain-containing protein [Absidia repens]|uniref:PPPDE putative peptidase domain-domain-containing protein n=1 Tax=Absidia repens TaxID=90262 RepID=A0A1X2IDW9_9FUNG|nr:PPPDE putative peptidase domain-domain-containing protein [Absidia repens]